MVMYLSSINHVSAGTLKNFPLQEPLPTGEVIQLHTQFESSGMTRNKPLKTLPMSGIRRSMSTLRSISANGLLLGIWLTPGILTGEFTSHYLGQILSSSGYPTGQLIARSAGIATFFLTQSAIVMSQVGIYAKPFFDSIEFIAAKEAIDRALSRALTSGKVQEIDVDDLFYDRYLVATGQLDNLDGLRRMLTRNSTKP